MARRRVIGKRANSGGSDEFPYKTPDHLVQKARVVFQDRMNRELTDDEAREMLERSVAFLRLLINWDRADKRRHAEILNDGGSTQGEVDIAISGERAPEDRENKPGSENLINPDKKFEVVAARLRKSTRARQQTPAETLQREGREER